MPLPNVILKRYNGSTYDELYPKTSVEQVTGLQTILDAKVDESALGAAGGVATLGANSQLTYSQIPAFLLDGRNGWFGAIAVNTTLAALVTTINGLVSSTGAQIEDFYGGYFQVTAATADISWTNTGTDEYTLSPTDEGDTTSPVQLESGDLVLFVGYLAGTPNIWSFSVVNSHYSDATTAIKGVVTLSDATTTADTGNAVITESVLNGLIGTGAGQIAAGNHTHSYQPLDTDLTAIAALAHADGNFIVSNGTAWIVENGATARASLGLTIGTHVQAYDAGLLSIAGLTTAADRMIYTTALDTYAVTPITAFGRSLVDDADAAAARTTLGLVIGTNVQAFDQDLADIAGLTKTSGNMIYTNGTSWLSGDAATIRTNLSVYSTTQVDTKLTNKPDILYDTLTATVSGTIVIDVV